MAVVDDEGAPQRTRARARARLVAAHVALVCSGAAGLVYQTAWSRQLLRIFGVGEFANATVLTAYFLGLGLGGSLGDQLVARTKRPARAYAMLELCVALFALASGPVLLATRGAYTALGGSLGFGGLSALRLLLALVVLLPPTVVMGATLPLVAAGVRHDATHGWASGASRLYVSNTLGGVFGAALTGFVLIPRFGVRASTVLAACASALAGAIVWAAFRAVAPVTPAAIERATEGADTSTGALEHAPASARVPSIAVLSFLAGFAGFTALASEVVWTRGLRMALDGTSTTFASMLSVFLAGIVLAGGLVRLLHRAGVDPLRAFGVTQLVAALASLVSMAALRQVPRAVMLIARSVEMPPLGPREVLSVSCALLLPIATMTGASVPLLWHAGEAAGPMVGRILSVNTLGGLLGALVAGFVLVPAAGIDASLVLLALALLLSSAVGLRAASTTTRARIVALVAPGSFAIALLAVAPSVDVPYLLFARRGGAPALVQGASWRPSVAFLREGRNTTVALTVSEADGSLQLTNDGRPESGLGPGPVGFGQELVLLGSLGSLFAARLDRAMAVGFGGGHTTAVLLAGGFAQVDVVELEGAVVDAARVMYRARQRPFPLDDARARLTVDDARARLLLAAPASYDAVVSQPSHPWLAGSSALYTREFVAEARRALRPDGVFVVWANLFRNDVAHLRMVVATIRTQFPHVLGFVVEGSSLVLCASPSAMRVDGRFVGRMAQPTLRAFLAPSRLGTPEELLARLELDPAGAARFSDGVEPLTDDRPRLEFDLAKLPDRTVVTVAQLDQALRSVPWASDPIFWRDVPRDRWNTVLFARGDVAASRAMAFDRLARSVSTVAPGEGEVRILEAFAAQHRGDAAGAIALLERSGVNAALDRAELLRLEEDRLDELLDRAAVSGRARRATNVLAAAALRGEGAFAARALALAPTPSGDETRLDRALRAHVSALADGGCTAVSALAYEPAIEGIGVPRVALESLRRRCLEQAHASVRDAALALQRELAARRALASEQLRLARAGEHSATIAVLERRFRAALRYNAVLGPAAVGLATLLARTQRATEAQALLRETYGAAEGLDSTRATLRQGARALHIELEGSTADAPASSSNTAGVPAEAPAAD